MTAGVAPFNERRLKGSVGPKSVQRAKWMSGASPTISSMVPTRLDSPPHRFVPELASRRIPIGRRLLRLLILSLGVLSLGALGVATGAAPDDLPRYLAFQIHSTTIDPKAMRLVTELPPQEIGRVVSDLRNRIAVLGTDNRHLGFIVGPIAFDDTDDKVREPIRSGFETALSQGVAVGFHIDDVVFWRRLEELNTRENLEWLDWEGTPNKGRRLNWDPPNVMRFTPVLCLNSQGVRRAVGTRAALIGTEIAKWLQDLKGAGKEDLFIGVIAGWETEIGRDFDTGKTLGYCALTNAGYSEKNPPVDIDEARSKIVKDYIELWAQTLTDVGVPHGKIYSHIALGTEKSAASAFCDLCAPGTSTYPFPGFLQTWRKDLASHGHPPWASCEGAAIDPREAKRGQLGIGMEGYLGNLFKRRGFGEHIRAEFGG